MFAGFVNVNEENLRGNLYLESIVNVTISHVIAMMESCVPDRIMVNANVAPVTVCTDGKDQIAVVQRQRIHVLKTEVKFVLAMAHAIVADANVSRTKMVGILDDIVNFVLHARDVVWS